MKPYRLALVLSFAACSSDPPAGTPSAPRAQDQEQPDGDLPIDDFSSVRTRVQPRWTSEYVSGPFEELVFEGFVENVMEEDSWVEVVAIASGPGGMEEQETLVALATLQAGEVLEVAVAAKDLRPPSKGAPTDVVLAARFPVDPQGEPIESRSEALTIELVEEGKAATQLRKPITDLDTALFEAALQAHAQGEGSENAPSLPLTTQPDAAAGPGLTVDVEVCATWGVSYADTDEQQAFLGQPGRQYPSASFARIIISEPGDPFAPWVTPPIVYEGFLDAYGCTGILGLPAQRYTYALETQLDDGTTTINVRPGAPTGFGYAPGSFHTGAGGLVHTRTREDQATTRVAAIMSRALTVGDLPMGTAPLNIYAGANCDFDPSGYAGCARTHAFWIGTNNDGEDLTRWRHVVGHELGHVVQRRGTNAIAVNYGQWTGESECRCDHVTSSNSVHCLQSAETLAAAFVEGFAHFTAARLFNDNASSFCRFSYYKEFLDAGTIESPPYRVNCGFPIQWQLDYCPDPTEGTEYDWMNFLWTINRQGSDTVTLPELFDAIDDACPGAGNCALNWPDLEAAIGSSTTLSPSQKTNFLFAASWFAVDF